VGLYLYSCYDKSLLILESDDRDESELAKSFARTRNNFAPIREKIFRSIQAFFSEPPELEEGSTWPTVAPFSTVEERLSTVGVRNDAVPSVVAGRPIKARKTGKRKRPLKGVPSSALPLLGEDSIGSQAGDEEVHDSITSDLSQARCPGEVVRDVELEADDPFSGEPPPSERIASRMWMKIFHSEAMRW
jgi:hypothetical protein